MLTQRVQKHFLSRFRDISFQRPALLSHPTTLVPTFYQVLSGVDPDVNVTLNVEILPEFEVALRWQVSDHRESAYLYKLTVSSQSQPAFAVDPLKRSSVQQAQFSRLN